MRNAVTQEFGPVPDTARYYKVGNQWGQEWGPSGTSWWLGGAEWVVQGRGAFHLGAHTSGSAVE